MFSMVQKRRWFYIFSSCIIVPGIVIMIFSLITTGTLFRLSNDFIGGSQYELKFTAAGATEDNIRDVFTSNGNTDLSIQQVGDPSNYEWTVRANFQDQKTQDAIVAALGKIAPLDQPSLEVDQVSPTVGQEVTRAAFVAVILASVVVTLFIVLAFRQIPNALRYGVCAIIAMFHDVFVVAGVMSLMGLLFHWEVDALFLTAVLMVVGFSVQDTIVLFDRIRENIPKHLGEPYDVIVNRSILETIHRSLAIQLNVFFIIIAVLLFGGESIKQFIFILFIGLLTGTYSSIFIAVPLLVSWEHGEIPFVNRRRPATLKASEA
ncbi:MAG TPA: protein translocase subunit SecF [Phototrophicaceae bacterium]|nr:protein translocase subunit SecF [Phototrophicaceae bacterium]